MTAAAVWDVAVPLVVSVGVVALSLLVLGILRRI